MSRKIYLSIGENYHIYSRGVDKRVIFQNKRDYERFLILLYLCNSAKQVHLSDYPHLSFSELLDIKRGEQIVDIGAYCLMPNHFHLLLYEKSASGISKFMQKIITAYTMYFNKKNERTGSLFSGTFKANHADKDEYLKYLFSYIHLNPIKLIDPNWKENGVSNKEKVKNFLNSYNYSSYLDCTGQERKQKILLNLSPFPKYFEDFTAFDSFIENWITCQVKVSSQGLTSRLNLDSCSLS